MDDFLGVTDQMVFTPAERAVMVEQAQSIKVALTMFIEACREGKSTRSMIENFIPVINSNDYIVGLFGAKASTVLTKMMRDET